jgi:tRNA(fMet)-specific endonuclease VapC
MLWMLDTNTCSYVLRRRPLEVKERFDVVGHEHLIWKIAQPWNC